jgi:hypothetical protein
MFGPEEPSAVGAFTPTELQITETPARWQPRLGGVTWVKDSDTVTLLKGQAQHMQISVARIQCLAAGVFKNDVPTSIDQRLSSPKAFPKMTNHGLKVSLTPGRMKDGVRLHGATAVWPPFAQEAGSGLNL